MRAIFYICNNHKTNNTMTIFILIVELSNDTQENRNKLQEQYDAKLTNVKKIHDGAIGWVITLNCGTDVILPSTTIFTVEGQYE